MDEDVPRPASTHDRGAIIATVLFLVGFAGMIWALGDAIGLF